WSSDIRGRRPVLQPSSYRMFNALQAAASCSGGDRAFKAFQADINSASAALWSLDDPVGSPPVRWTMTFQSQTPPRADIGDLIAQIRFVSASSNGTFEIAPGTPR